jgi:TIM-barrel protein
MGLSRNPSILAAMAGITNGDFARNCLENGAGMATIGGYSIGREMIRASVKITRRGRQEFILPIGKESEEITRETQKISSISNLIVNLRLNNPKNALEFARKFESLNKEKPILEINAHCRQREITQLGGGQGLLQRFNVLSEIINILHSKDYLISLKFRGNAISPDELIPQINKLQLDFLHIDSYKIGEEGTDLVLLKHYTNVVNTPIIGNNSVVDIESAQTIMETGVQYFSIARAAKKNPSIFRSIVKHL